MFLIFSFALSLFVFTQPAAAQELEKEPCNVADRACVISALKDSADKIENKDWRDQTYREIAKTMAFDGDVDGAIALIEQIQNPDKKAMTIRGIGMAVADNKPSPESYNAAFTKLRAEAEKIEHPPSYAIALTYIAMSQAFAGDNEGAWKTASEMQNEALRHKAYGETAEIQAEKGDFAAAMKSISYIQSTAFRNKAYAITSKLLADQGNLEGALNAAQRITNDYKKSKSLQYVLDTQKPREVERK